MSDDGPESGPVWMRWAGLVAGPIVAAALYFALPAETRDASGGLQGLGHAGRATAAVAALMAVWWLSEALPLEATALLPLALFPVLGVAGIKEAAAPYASDVIYLFMGGLILGLGMERWGLHRRVALLTLRLVGTSPPMLVGGVMLATALISMWVSNTATAVMMLPIGMGLVAMVDEQRGAAGGGQSERERRGFATCVMLGIAYAATIGGVGTLVGTPPNGVMAGFARERGMEPALTFARWLWIGIPIMVVFLPLCWLLLTRVLYRLPRGRVPGMAERIRGQWVELGAMSRGEWAVLVVFLSAAALWVFRVPLMDGLALRASRNGKPIEMLTDAGIAVAAALALFLIPVNLGKREFVMDWATASRLPFGVLLLFGGGLSLADAFTANGVDVYLGGVLRGLQGVPPVAIVALVTTIVVFVTEVASNTAVATAFMPIALAVADRLGVHPYILMLPVAVGASYAFMMPMGTPPNAMVFATGRVTMRQMAGAGILLNLLSIVVITIAAWWLAPWALGLPKP